MSLVAKLMIGGWITTLTMIGFCALNESGKLHKIGKRIRLWLETLAPAARSSNPTQEMRPDGRQAS